LIGFTADRHGLYNSFWLLAVFSGIGLLIMWLGVKKLKQV